MLLAEGTRQYHTKDGDAAWVRKIWCRTRETDVDPELDLRSAWRAPSLSINTNVRLSRMASAQRILTKKTGSTSRAVITNGDSL